MDEYIVEWSNIYEAKDQKDALRQALADLDESIKYKRGATCFFISGRYGEDKNLIDIEWDDPRDDLDEEE